jgi:hypothetical protein
MSVVNNLSIIMYLQPFGVFLTLDGLCGGSDVMGLQEQ